MTIYRLEGRSPRVSRRTMLKSAGIAGAGIAGAVLIGCSDDDNEAGPAATAGTASAGAATPAVKRGGTFRLVGSGDAPAFDPHTQSAAVSNAWKALVYSKLARPPLTLSTTAVEPDAAERWEIPDASTYIFKLRPGIKFHQRPPVNGRELDSEDVRRGAERQRTDKPEFQYKQAFAGVTIETPDPRTVVFKLKTPDVGFLQLQGDINTTPVVPKEMTNLETENQIGTGPFMFESYTRGNVLKFKRNPDYYDKDRPRADGLEYSILPEASSQQAAFRGRQVDSLSLPFEVAKTMKTTVTDATYLDPRPISSTHLFLRLNLNRIQDVRIRQALMYAIDVDEIIKIVYGGGGVRNGPLASLWKDWALPENELPKADPQRARQLLDAAGAVGKRYVIFTSANYQDQQDIGAVMQEHLKKVGIETRLDFPAHAEFLQAFFLPDWGNRDIGIHGGFTWEDPGTDIYNNFGTGSGRNFVKLSDKRVDDYVTRLRSTVEFKARQQLAREAQRYLLEIVPQIPLLSKLQVHALQKRVKGFQDSYGAWDYVWVNPWIDA